MQVGAGNERMVKSCTKGLEVKGYLVKAKDRYASTYYVYIYTYIQVLQYDECRLLRNAFHKGADVGPETAAARR